MFVKINEVIHINTETARLIWDWDTDDKELRFSIYSDSMDRTEKVKGYSFEDFKTLYNYYKQNNLYFMDLTIPREDHIRVCDQCDGIFRHKELCQDRVCYSCDGTGKFRLLL